MEEGKSNYQESGKLKILTTIDGSLFWEPFLLWIADCGLRIVCSTPWADCGLWIVDCGLCPPKLSEGGFEHCGLWIVDCGLRTVPAEALRRRVAN
jgi:hypothetical protein